LSAERFVSLLKEWADKYSILAIEDGLADDDWDGWRMMQTRLGQDLMLAGDDLFAAQAGRLQKGIEMNAANAIVIKPSQAGTVTEALDTVALAQKNNYKVIASHRSAETNDDFIADFAVGIGADYIKAGSVARGENTVKYNRLMQIETEIKE
jgi:enolase